MEPTEQIPAKLKDRFENITFLGRGGQGLTFRGIRKSDQTEVVLKVLDFLELSSWKNYDLFLREISILKNLNHPAIPNVLEVFPETTQGDEPEAVVLVQEFFDGESLKELLDGSDEPWSEEKIGEFLAEVLGILTYLHGLNPPVVHRDIKPSNIIRRPDGSYALIDFGAASASQKTNASTFVGTNGYMAPEQMMGRAEPRSDLYSLGATALHLATGIHPTNLNREDFSFSFGGLGLTPFLTRVLGRLVQPLPERRFRSAAQVLQALDPSQAMVLADVKEHGLRLVRNEDDTQIFFPGAPREQMLALALVSVLFLIPVFLGFGNLFFLLFFSLLPAGAFFYYFLRRRRLVFEGRVVRYVKSFGPFSFSKKWDMEGIIDVRSQQRGKYADIVVQDRSSALQGLGWGLSQEQAHWLVRHVETELEERR